ncbi:MAG: class I SAM-dependent methyltransferase [Acidimicrobiales bacterium]
MDWRAKALLQGAFSLLPRGHDVNYLFQRHITHGLPLQEHKLDEMVELAGHHAAALAQRGRVPLGACRAYEFGAGWDLGMPLLLYCAGVNHQTIVDIRPLTRVDLVADLARRLRSKDLPAAFVRRPEEPGGDDLDGYLARHGISYRAPLDRSTGLPAGSVDGITSTNTLEHIPPADIAAILRECRRLLAPGGVMSFQIDYQDHYSYFDPSISVYNFLRYDDRRWRLYNPSLHFQNRLRHRDYLDLIAGAGLAVAEAETDGGSADEIGVVAALPPDDRFATYGGAELAVRRSRLVLVPRPEGASSA